MMLTRIEIFMTRRRILLVAALITATTHAGVVTLIARLLP